MRVQISSASENMALGEDTLSHSAWRRGWKVEKGQDVCKRVFPPLWNLAAQAFDQPKSQAET